MHLIFHKLLDIIKKDFIYLNQNNDEKEKNKELLLIFKKYSNIFNGFQNNTRKNANHKIIMKTKYKMDFL